MPLASLVSPAIVATSSIMAFIAGGALVLGTRRRRALVAGERAWRATHPVAADGVIPGAGTIARDGGERAALLLHGFGDTPQSLARQAYALHARGWTVRVPLLPGHGRTLEEFRRSTAAQWDASARHAYASLAASHSHVAIVGLSMGGALATRVAADAVPPPASLVLIVPYMHLSASARFWTTVWPLWSLWRAWVPGNPAASVRDPEARRASLGYGASTPRLLRELRRVVDGAASVAPRLRVPTLAIFSTGDYRISPEAARQAFAAIGASEKSFRWVEQSGHVVTVDFDADEVTAQLVDWLERHPATTSSNG